MDDFINDNDLSPLEQFLKNPDIDMLHSAFPYIPEHLRKPLALCIKSMEIKRIVTDFDREEILSACGFEKNTPDPEAMLKAMKMAGGKNASPQIDQLLQMVNLIKTYQSLNEVMQNNPELISFLANMMTSSNPNFTVDE